MHSTPLSPSQQGRGAILVIEVSLQHPEMLVAGDPPEVLLRLTERRRRPPHRHLSVAPAADAPRVLANARVRRVDDVRRRQAPAQCRGQREAIDGEQESQVIALRLGRPPRGFANWSLRLLARRVVELGVVESISHETIRRTLKKAA